MSASFTTTLFLQAEPERVFSTLTSLEATPNWMHGLTAIEKLTPGPVAVGSEWRETRLRLGEKATEIFEVVAMDPPRSLQLRCDARRGSAGGDGEFILSYQLEPQDEGSLLVLRGVLRKPGFVQNLLSRFEVETLRKVCEKDLVALKRFLETGRRVSGVFIAVS